MAPSSLPGPQHTDNRQHASGRTPRVIGELTVSSDEFKRGAYASSPWT